MYTSLKYAESFVIIKITIILIGLTRMFHYISDNERVGSLVDDNHDKYNVFLEKASQQQPENLQPF